MNNHILLVEDEENLSYFIKRSLEHEGFSVSVAHSLREARNAAAGRFPDVLLLDLNLPDGNGLDLFCEFKDKGYDLPCVVITAHGSVPSAIEAMKKGVDDYIIKPFDINEITMLIGNLLQRFSLKIQLNYYRNKAQCGKDQDFFLSSLPEMRDIQELARKIARVPAGTVLIEGPTGCGKEMYARYIHNISAQSRAPFVEINCASLSETLLESELFGYEPGAFTGAARRKIGLIELANGGTLFLDEIGEMSPDLQARLLRFTDNHSFRRLGGLNDIRVSLRIIAATNKDIGKLVREQRFREDLFFRLSLFRLSIPPLSRRKDELLLLAQFLIDKISRRLNKKAVLSSDCYDLLLSYDWPGNIRELNNVLERAIILSDSGLITADHFPRDLRKAAGSPSGFKAELHDLKERSLKAFLADIEKSILQQAYLFNDRNQLKTARMLKEPRHIIRYLLKKYHIS